MDDNKKSIFDRVFEVINNCPAEEYCNLNVAWIARKINVSESYLSRAANEECRWSLRFFIEFEKMNEAYDLVLQGDMTVKEISEFFGYSSPHYFSKKFAEHWFLPPTEFRKKMEMRRRAFEEKEAAKKAAAVPGTTGDKKEGVKTDAPANTKETTTPEEEKPLLEIVKNRMTRYVKRKFSK